MRSLPRLGLFNLALVAAYFVPVWGIDALRALLSPFGGLEDRAQAAAIGLIPQLFDVGSHGLMRASNIFAAMKLVVTAGFVAYLIEYARALAVAREPDRETVDVVLALAAAAAAIWTIAALAQGDAALIRLHATQVVLVAGAVIVVTVERHATRDLKRAA